MRISDWSSDVCSSDLAAVPADALGQRRLIQPFMPGVLAEGEYSLFLFGGRYSHPIVKRPAAGDFRVQPQFGGPEEAGEGSAAASDVATAGPAEIGNA